jgi:hypothetical protein
MGVPVRITRRLTFNAVRAWKVNESAIKEFRSEIKVNKEHKNLNFLTCDLHRRAVVQSHNSQGRPRGYEESHKTQSLLRWDPEVRSGLIQQFLILHTWLGYVPATRCHPSRDSLQYV